MEEHKDCCEKLSDSDVIRSIRSDVQDLRGDVSDLRSRITGPVVKAGALFVLVSQIIQSGYSLWKETLGTASAAPPTVSIEGK